MTGLDPVADALVEIAVLVTDAELNVLGEGVDIVIRPPQAALDQMVPFVRDMHTSSGLLDRLDDGVSLAEASRACLDYITDHLHYRIVDVSTLKELARRWYPKAYFQAPAKTGGHRALGDIIDSINELRYYREAVLVPAPGPDSKAAQRIAAGLQTVTSPGH